ncbi:hypothetical protein [Bradyrhizobium sp. Lot33]
MQRFLEKCFIAEYSRVRRASHDDPRADIGLRLQLLRIEIGVRPETSACTPDLPAVDGRGIVSTASLASPEAPAAHDVAARKTRDMSDLPVS